MEVYADTMPIMLFSILSHNWTVEYTLFHGENFLIMSNSDISEYIMSRMFVVFITTLCVCSCVRVLEFACACIIM